MNKFPSFLLYFYLFFYHVILHSKSDLVCSVLGTTQAHLLSAP